MLTDLEKQLQLEFFPSQRLPIGCNAGRADPGSGRSIRAPRSAATNPASSTPFIGKPLTPRAYTMPEMRETFLSFFEEHEHTRVARYPVVARLAATTST